MRVLVAMSGGVDSSVAAALVAEAGHDVVGVTLKLWGGAQSSGCCSVGDVEDARRVAQQLGVPHYVFNFTDAFEREVVGPYLDAHLAGRTPNPCVACNAQIKFDRLLSRADELGFDAVATGHHARNAWDARAHRWRLVRGADPAKDQSYVLYMLGQEQLARLLFPVGALAKADVRAQAARRGLRTAAKPDSQDTCFITASGGRRAFLAERAGLRPGRVVEARTGKTLGSVPAVELATVGQRRGLGLGGGPEGGRYVVDVDVATVTVTVGSARDLLTDRVPLEHLRWVDEVPAPGTPVCAQVSAHGGARAGTWDGAGVAFLRSERRVAPGQAVVLYDGDDVVGGGTAA